MVFITPSWLEPLMPTDRNGRLTELAVELLRESAALGAAVPRPIRPDVVRLLRSMNSYYTNRIEGHRTHPRDIERALRKDFSSDPAQRDLQELALAHIDVQKLLEERLASEPELNIASEDFIRWIHREFYSKLPESLRTHRGDDNVVISLDPGRLRDGNVRVGKHVPPPFSVLPEFLKRFEDRYRFGSFTTIERVIAVAASHHRLAWIHPFFDGNGRVARLFSHAALIRSDVHGYGLWSMMRGLAQKRDDYFTALEWGDESRHGALDGRGHLSDGGLGHFCRVFLEIALDQVRFMRELLDVDKLEGHVLSHLRFRIAEGTFRPEAAKLIREVYRHGEVSRGAVGAITSLGDRTARELTSTLLKSGYLASPTPKGPLRLGLPEEAIAHYFPGLYPELSGL